MGVEQAAAPGLPLTHHADDSVFLELLAKAREHQPNSWELATRSFGRVFEEIADLSPLRLELAQPQTWLQCGLGPKPSPKKGAQWLLIEDGLLEEAARVQTEARLNLAAQKEELSLKQAQLEVRAPHPARSYLSGMQAAKVSVHMRHLPAICCWVSNANCNLQAMHAEVAFAISKVQQARAGQLLPVSALDPLWALRNVQHHSKYLQIMPQVQAELEASRQERAAREAALHAQLQAEVRRIFGPSHFFWLVAGRVWGRTPLCDNRVPKPLTYAIPWPFVLVRVVKSSRHVVRHC